jgi:MFS family permease
VVFTLRGFCAGLEEMLGDAMVAEILASGLRGTGFGVMAGVNGVGDLLSSVAVGWLWHAAGPTAGFGWAALLMFLGAIMLLGSREHG